MILARQGQGFDAVLKNRIFAPAELASVQQGKVWGSCECLVLGAGCAWLRSFHLGVAVAPGANGAGGGRGCGIRAGSGAGAAAAVPWASCCGRGPHPAQLILTLLYNMRASTGSQGCPRVWGESCRCQDGGKCPAAPAASTPRPYELRGASSTMVGTSPAYVQHPRKMILLQEEDGGSAGRCWRAAALA